MLIMGKRRRCALTQPLIIQFSWSLQKHHRPVSNLAWNRMKGEELISHRPASPDYFSLRVPPFVLGGNKFE